MYIVSTDCHKECYTDYVIKNLDDVHHLLLNEEFLEEYDWKFDKGITGFRWGESKEISSPIELIVQYWNGYRYEELTLYLNKVKVIGE